MIKLNIYYTTKSKKPHQFTKLTTKKGESNYYNVYFCKDFKENHSDITYDLSYTLEIEEEAINYDLDSKIIYIHGTDKNNTKLYQFNITELVTKKSDRTFEATPKFSEVFETMEDSPKNDDGLKF